MSDGGEKVYKDWKQKGVLNIEPLLSKKLGYDVELGPSVLDAASFAPRKQMFVDGSSVGYLLPELGEDAIYLGYTEEELLDYYASSIRSVRGERVEPLPWLRMSEDRVAALLTRNVELAVAEVKTSPERRQLALNASVLVGRALRQLPYRVVVHAIQAPVGGLVVEHKGGILRPAVQVITTHLVYAGTSVEKLAALVSSSIADYLEGVLSVAPRHAVLYFAPYCLPLPTSGKPEKWRMRFAHFVHNGELGT